MNTATTPQHDNTAPALLLLGHGSRQARWRAPIDLIHARVQAAHPGICELAFLEFMNPSLPEALQTLADAGHAQLCIVPLFWSTGEHVARDIEEAVQAFHSSHPGVRVQVAPSLGQAEAIQTAVVGYALAQGQSPI
jgi:sirohydrochlorin cobaltochelatase